jgi:hypothetical protein
VAGFVRTFMKRYWRGNNCQPWDFRLLRGKLSVILILQPDFLSTSSRLASSACVWTQLCRNTASSSLKHSVANPTLKIDKPSPKSHFLNVCNNQSQVW